MGKPTTGLNELRPVRFDFAGARDPHFYSNRCGVAAALLGQCESTPFSAEGRYLVSVPHGLSVEGPQTRQGAFEGTVFIITSVVVQTSFPGSRSNGHALE